MPSALIHRLYSRPLSPEDIEALSFLEIDSLADLSRFSTAEREIIRRMIHATADLTLADEVRFSGDSINAGISALRRGCPIYLDAQMARAGLSLARLRRIFPKYDSNDLLCHVSDDDVAQESRQSGLPRSIFAVRKAASRLDGALVVIGNAPVALLELNRLIAEENLKPALVIGVPVGFVHVVQSKQELASLSVPSITVQGRRGGSAMAVSVVHALCTLSEQGCEK